MSLAFESLLQEASLGRGVHLGQGSSIGRGSKFGVEGRSFGAGVPSAGHHHRHDRLALSNETEYYRPDPGSPFAREGDSRVNTTHDGHNHWPEAWVDREPSEDREADVISSESGGSGAETSAAEGEAPVSGVPATLAK